MPHLLCIGMGYTAQTLASRLRERGWNVTGTSRAGEGIRYRAGNPEADFRAALAGATHLLISVPPAGRGCPVISDIEGWRGWIGYMSSTGIYGDHQGKWVDETAIPLPDSPRTTARLLAETQWRERGATIFRLAGIYGPSRNMLERVRAGTARRIDAPGHYTSRIHVEDIATVIEAAIMAPDPGAIYNVADDEPSPPNAPVEYACALLGKPLPPLQTPEDTGMTPMARSFFRSNRKVANHKIKQALGITLQYPSYREGLQALLKHGMFIA